MSEFRREKAVLSLAVARKCEFVTSDTSRPVQVLMSEQAEQSARLMQHVLLIAAGLLDLRPTGPLRRLGHGAAFL